MSRNVARFFDFRCNRRTCPRRHYRLLLRGRGRTRTHGYSRPRGHHCRRRCGRGSHLQPPYLPTDTPEPPTPEPTPDLQATVIAMLAAAEAARPTVTPVPTPTPAPTNTPVPTSTPGAYRVSHGHSFQQPRPVKYRASSLASSPTVGRTGQIMPRFWPLAKMVTTGSSRMTGPTGTAGTSFQSPSTMRFFDIFIGGDDTGVDTPRTSHRLPRNP